MESLKSISILEIPTNRIFYDKKTKILSIEIMDFMFVGTYNQSTRINKILDDIYASLGNIQLTRSDIYFVDFVTNTQILETTKLKHLKLLSKKKAEKKIEEPTEKSEYMEKEKDELHEMEEEEYYDEDYSDLESVADDKVKYKEEIPEEVELLKRDISERKESRKSKETPKTKKKAKAFPSPARPSARAPAPPVGGPVSEVPRSAIPPPPSDALAGPGAPPPKPITEPTIVTPEEPQPTIYEINMGLQYYSVMMEQRSYLFYVYFSHKELKIVDEEGKTVYETTFKIVTTKEEPPVLDLKIAGEGFEVHPISGKVEVKKDAVNPPVMIFSIMPLKSKKDKKKKKESERRYLNVYIEFEEQIISHTILSIIVQPKYFRLDIGPFHLNLSRKTAAIISFVSILVAGISLIWTIFSWDPSSSFVDLLGGFVPGLGSIAFFAIFLITIFKEGIYPLKEKISAFLNFDQAGVLIK